MKKEIALCLAIIGLVVCLIFAAYYSINLKEIRLRNLAEAEIQKVEIVHDQMWKTISQEAQITSEYRKGFDSIYTHIMDGRYKEEGTLMKWIQESNPNFSPDLYKKLMIDVEALREKFSQTQIKVEDVRREHNNVIQNPFYALFLKNTEPIEYEVISSGTTKKVIETREDNEVDIKF